MPTNVRHSLACGLPGLLLVAAALVGCGDMPRGRLHGTLSFRKEPLAGATVMFLTRDNQVYRADLDAEGSYMLEGVPQGPVKVAVQQPLASVSPRPDPPPGARVNKPDMQEARDAAWKPPVIPPIDGQRLPMSYGDPNTSGLAFELTGADQEWSAELP
jgi:hypothetical protein